MIGFLEGIVFDAGVETFILNVNGVGYDISDEAVKSKQETKADQTDVERSLVCCVVVLCYCSLFI